MLISWFRRQVQRKFDLAQRVILSALDDNLLLTDWDLLVAFEESFGRRSGLTSFFCRFETIVRALENSGLVHREIRPIGNNPRAVTFSNTAAGRAEVVAFRRV